MRVYAESNYILEIALRQEQEADCRRLLTACSDSRIELVLPAFCFAEPVQTVRRRASERSQLRTDLDRNLNLLARTTTHKNEVERLRDVTGLLAQANEAERQGLRITLQALIEHARVLELSAGVLTSAQDLETLFDLQLGDAIVCAHVLRDLEARPRGPACFVTRDRKDFDQPDLLAEFAAHECKVLFDFGAAAGFARA